MTAAKWDDQAAAEAESAATGLGEGDCVTIIGWHGEVLRLRVSVRRGFRQVEWLETTGTSINTLYPRSRGIDWDHGHDEETGIALVAAWTLARSR